MNIVKRILKYFGFYHKTEISLTVHHTNHPRGIWLTKIMFPLRDRFIDHGTGEIEIFGRKQRERIENSYNKKYGKKNK